MAGKSTLMEFLRHGDGSSIGKGAPRTTKDVHTYRWHGLDITDVPGIGAFNGEEDEMIAFDAAKRADLIIFLLTEDGPKPVWMRFPLLWKRILKPKFWTNYGKSDNHP